MPEVSTTFDRVLDQHATLRGMVAELREYLKNPRPNLDSRECETWAQCLAESLTVLHGKVLGHFREEERSGFLDDLEDKHPRATHAIESLRRDHDRILAEFRAILSAVMVYSEGHQPANPQIRRWVSSLLDQLTSHEQEETELFQGLQYQELGEGD
jgi:hypothetical protein